MSAIRYRHRMLGLQRVIYVVDARQSQHFQQLFYDLPSCRLRSGRHGARAHRFRHDDGR
ncbi:arginine--tRNA ligase [Undibacterium arcticum]